MKAAYVRLALALALFAGWLGYLGYLVAERPSRATILSRPQFLLSDLDVVADVNAATGVATVTEVLYPDTETARQLVGKEIKVINLADCRPPRDVDNKHPDVSADGKYLLPLQDAGPQGAAYRVTPTPPSPGFGRGTPRVYPYSKEVDAEYRRIPKN